MKSDELLCPRPRDGELEFENLAEVIDTEDSAEEPQPVKWSRPQVPSSDVNALHRAYISSGSQSARDNLLLDIHNYILRLALGDIRTLQKFGFEAEDAAQGFLAHIMSPFTRGANQGVVRLDTFRGGSKFSTWIADCFYNYQTDKIRAHIVDSEVPMDEAKSYEESSGRSGYCATPNESDDDNTDPARVLYGPAVVEAAADKIINAVLLEKFVNRLSAHEQTALRLMAEGCTVSEIVAKLKLSKRDVSKLYHLRERLRKQSIYDTAGVVVHTCQLTLSELPSQPLVGYLKEGEHSYRRLPLTCRCRKTIPLSEAAALVERGEVQHIHHVNKKGEVVIDMTRVWAPQFTPAAPAPAIPASHGSFIGQRDLEIAHQMSVETWRSMTTQVPADEYDRVREEQSGRHNFTPYTPTGKDYANKPPPWKPPVPCVLRYTLVSLTVGGCHLKNNSGDPCRGGVVSRGVYPDGCIRTSCTCGSLMVQMVSPSISTVSVMKRKSSPVVPATSYPIIPEAGVYDSRSLLCGTQ